MKSLALIFFGLIATGCCQPSFASASSKNQTCVLIFERPGTPIFETVNKVFSGQPGVEVFPTALPIDILTCVRERYQEILIVAHALEDAKGKEPTTLGYYRALDCEERAEALSKDLASLRNDLDKVNRHLVTQPTHPKAGKDFQSQKALNDKVRLERLIEFYETYPDDRPYYVIRPFLPHIMEVVRAELAAQAQSPEKTALKRIRIASCQSDLVYNSFPALKTLKEENGITLEFAPKSSVWSFFYGKPVTQPLPSWLEKSLLRH